MMLQSSIRVRGLLLGAMALTLAACASVPTQLMSNARQAVAAAREAHAGDYAPENMRRAEQRLDIAAQEIENRNFRAARHQADRAQREAQSALEVTRGLLALDKAIADAQGRAGNVDEARRLQQEATLAARRGDAPQALLLIRRASAFLP
ncbi:MAG: DUF4398 domain-containing protein [Gammaproteobacteria bacterium]|nr:DUF4398 domain-containing protein [Gammaproteobacteria bacterium]